MRIEIYSDVMCPWCYIGERRLARALAAFPGGDAVEVAYRPYQLDPDAPATAVPMRTYLERRFGARGDDMQRHVADAALGEGIRMDFEKGLAVNTLAAHRLLRLAGQEYGGGVQRALAERLFAAHFEHGADVSDAGVLAGLAAEAGMDAGRAREYLAAGEGLEETRADLAAAAGLGIRAVPTFVIDGRYAVEGAQPTSALLKVLEDVAAETSRDGAGDDAEGAACADGSCAI